MEDTHIDTREIMGHIQASLPPSFIDSLNRAINEVSKGQSRWVDLGRVLNRAGEREAGKEDERLAKRVREVLKGVKGSQQEVRGVLKAVKEIVGKFEWGSVGGCLRGGEVGFGDVEKNFQQIMLREINLLLA